jgi:predicted RNase H-like HicB family nuclease
VTSTIALIRQEPKSDYSADFPDFLGVITAGHTLDEARRQATEALAFHIDGLLEDGEALPEPSSLDAIMTDTHDRDAVAVLVDLPRKSARSLWMNITLPEDILTAIDRVTNNRSRFLADAAKEKLRRA